MKNKWAIAALSALGGLAAAPAMAQENDESHLYAGVGINLYFIDKDDAGEGMGVIFEDQPSPGAFMGRVGYAFNDYVAVEVDAGFGGAKSDFSDGGLNNGEIGVSQPWAAHVVLTWPLGEGGGYLLGKAGYSSVKVERELNGVDAPDIDINGASFGVGAGLRSDNWDFRGEFGFMSGDASSGVLGFYALRRF